MEEILIIQLAKMGDLLQTSTLIRGIRKRHADASVTLLVTQKVREFAKGIPGVEEIIGFDFGRAAKAAQDGTRSLVAKYSCLASLVNGLKGRSFGAVYNLNYSPVNACLMNMINYQEALCYSLDKHRRKLVKSPWLSYLFSSLGDRRLNRLHLIDIYLHSVGVRPSSLTPSFLTDSGVMRTVDGHIERWGVDSHPLLVGFQLGAGHASRCWPLDSYVRLAEILVHELNATILLFGTASESSLGERFAIPFCEKTRSSRETSLVVNLMGKTNADKLAAYLSRCDLLVTPDTGTMHLAAAVGTQVLGLFLGPAFCHETGPYGPDHLVVHPRLNCYPCPENQPLCSRHECKASISADMVARLIRRSWDGPHRRLTTGDPDLSDSDVVVLRSEMSKDGVAYVPIGRPALSVEEALSRGYRAMWRGVLDGTWNISAVEAAHSLVHDYVASEGAMGELRRAHKDFDRIHRILNAYGFPATGPGRWASDLDQLVKVLRYEEAAGLRWTGPVTRFLDVESENIRSVGDPDSARIRNLSGRLAKGVAFMKAFCAALTSPPLCRN